MGISGLLPLLKSIHKPCNLRKFSSQTLGVDAYGWLHRGTIPCAIDLALGKPTTKYVDFVMHRVRMLIHFGITPYLVFDGDYLPSKDGTERERATKRAEAKEKGLELLRLGKIAQAHQELQKAVDVTPEMAACLMQELKKINVQYVVAPFEADSQLVYLEKQGLINGIVSEDSDLLVFGARVLVTKLDQYGECVMIRRDDFTACREISLVGWSDREFRRMAIMGGCDYLDNIQGMGLKTAYRLIRKHKTIERVLKAVQFDGKFKVPQGYLEAFFQAELTFLHQWVYCPEMKSLVNFTPLEGATLEEMPFIGQYVERGIAIGVAEGRLHPHTKAPLTPAGDYKPTPRRSWPSTKQTTIQTPDLKKNKSIQSFFKPTRVPLAELEPNLFAPTPHQEDVLRRNSGNSWQAVPAPVHTIYPPQRVPSLNVQLPPRRAVSDSFVRTSGHLRQASGSASSARPVKRQRLCVEGSSPPTEKGSTKVMEGESPFFSIGKTKSTSKMMSEGNLFSSDGELEEALLDLPDPAAFSSVPRRKSKGKSIAIFQDIEGDCCKNDAGDLAGNFGKGVKDMSQESVGSNDSVFSPVQDQSETQPTDLESQELIDSSDKKESIFDKHLRTSVKNLRSKFSCTPQDSGIAFNAEADELPEADYQEEEQPDIPDEAWAAVDAQIIVPASDGVDPATPAKASSRPSSNVTIKGSEDYLVPASEDDMSEVSSPEVMVKSKVFNVSRFAFTPR